MMALLWGVPLVLAVLYITICIRRVNWGKLE